MVALGDGSRLEQLGKSLLLGSKEREINFFIFFLTLKITIKVIYVGNPNQQPLS